MLATRGNGTRFFLALLLLSVLLAVQAPRSVAANQDGLARCSSLSDAIERPDGSIVAVGARATVGGPATGRPSRHCSS